MQILTLFDATSSVLVPCPDELVCGYDMRIPHSHSAYFLSSFSILILSRRRDVAMKQHEGVTELDCYYLRCPAATNVYIKPESFFKRNSDVTKPTPLELIIVQIYETNTMESKTRPNAIILNGHKNEGGSGPFSFLILQAYNGDTNNSSGPIALGDAASSLIPGYYTVMTTHFATFEPAKPNLAASVS